MTSTALLLWGVVFSAVGLGYFIYGRKQKTVVPLVCGLVLMIYPYFVGNVYVLIFIGIVVALLPKYIR
ncbi:MAG TPA: amino acid transport protein [Aeromonadales bacterium]|nr:amino acid transport protein [Aeromonadales bacterium]